MLILFGILSVIILVIILVIVFKKCSTIKNYLYSACKRTPNDSNDTNAKPYSTDTPWSSTHHFYNKKSSFILKCFMLLLDNRLIDYITRFKFEYSFALGWNYWGSMSCLGQTKGYTMQ